MLWGCEVNYITAIRESKTFKAIADISVVHWLWTVTPGIGASVAAILHGKPVEDVIFYFVSISALTFVALHYSGIAWKRFVKSGASENAATAAKPSHNPWKVIAPVVGLIIVLAVWFGYHIQHSLPSSAARAPISVSSPPTISPKSPVVSTLIRHKSPSFRSTTSSTSEN